MEKYNQVLGFRWINIFNWYSTSWSVIFNMFIEYGGPGPWGGSELSSTREIFVNYLVSILALSIECIKVLPLDLIGGDLLFVLFCSVFIENLVIDLTILHHFPGGIVLSNICNVIFSLYFCFDLRTMLITSLRKYR